MVSPVFGRLAQSVEQLTFNQWVVGSIPTAPTRQSLVVPETAENKKYFRGAYGEQIEKSRKINLCPCLLDNHPNAVSSLLLL